MEEDKNEKIEKKLDNKKNLFSFDLVLTLVLMIILSLGIINFLVSGRIYPQPKLQIDSGDSATQENYRNTVLNNNDPYITRNPNLPDLLTGPIINDSDPVQGDKYAKVDIFLFSDFTCNFCAVQEQTVKEILAEYKNEVRLFWKDYPETDQNSESFLAAIAGQCANQQEKFWPFHDLLYEFNDQLNADKFLEIAQLLNLDIGEFRECYNNKEPIENIKEDIEEATMLEITGIPFMFVGSQEVMGELSYEELERLIQLELEKG